MNFSSFSNLGVTIGCGVNPNEIIETNEQTEIAIRNYFDGRLPIESIHTLGAVISLVFNSSISSSSSFKIKSEKIKCLLSSKIDSRNYLEAFLQFFVPIRNYLKHEKLFKATHDICDLMSTITLNYGLEMASIINSFKNNDNVEIGVIEMLGFVVRLIRIFSRNEKLSEKNGEF